MDYHITDKYCDSDGIAQGPGGLVRPSTQKYYTEKLIFMNHCFLSYTPGLESFPVLQIQPAQKNGYLTIGTFNKLNKLNSSVISLWEQILKKCPNVKLVLKIKELNTEIIKERFFELWKDKSVISQIIVLPYSISYEKHLDTYNLIDIALDTLPYSGATTTCEALMMGTPVVSLFDSKRQYHVQNVSSSLLINSDLAEFVTFTEEEYIDKVCYYATHLDEVIGMKEQVRQKFSNGRVYDHVGFVDEFEDKLLQIYREHNW
jgi:predicted O-linked N-acetylglucosamine transferase (SPINDLY family)